jgi:hypothetical protein
LSFFLGFFVKAGKLVSHQRNLAHIFSALLRNLHPQHQPTYNLVSYSPADLFAVLLVKAPLRTNGEGVLSDLPYLLATFSQKISILYRVSFVGLSRRLRKIVKNKYRFRRQYVCVLPASRLRYGFHLVRFCLKFADGRTRLERLLSLVKSVLFQEDSSPILFMRYQQQKHVLGVLRKQYLLS